METRFTDHPSRFDLFKDVIKKIANIPMRIETIKSDPLHALFANSSEQTRIKTEHVKVIIAAEYIKPLADRLEELLPHLEEEWLDETKAFIETLRRAENKKHALTII